MGNERVAGLIIRLSLAAISFFFLPPFLPGAPWATVRGGGGGIEEGNKEHEIREKEKGRLVNELNVNTELKEGMLSGSGEVNTYI